MILEQNYGIGFYKNIYTGCVELKLGVVIEQTFDYKSWKFPSFFAYRLTEKQTEILTLNCCFLSRITVFKVYQYKLTFPTH